MTKHRLEWDDELEFLVIGIASHQKDYRMAWALNQVLHCGFQRIADYQNIQAKSTHAMFKWVDSEDRFSYHLIANRGEEAYLLPEFKQADYILLVEGLLGALDTTELIKHITKSTMVLTAFEIEETKSKSLQNIVLG